jgi:hypothetical protein
LGCIQRFPSRRRRHDRREALPLRVQRFRRDEITPETSIDDPLDGRREKHGTWKITSFCKQPPLIQGRQTLEMARVLYAIPDPSNRQLQLF